MINNIWILIGKKLNGEASPEELLELEELLKQGIADRYQVSMLEELWKTDHQTQAEEKLEDKWDAFEAKLIAADNEEAAQKDQSNDGDKRPFISRISKISFLIAAACFAIAFFWFTKNNVPTKGKNNEILAPQNGLSKIQLSDGTKVWLNSGSKLTYSADYGVEYRKVSIVGEALFDVVKDAKHPFIVTTPTISIKVLGTEFNVRSYSNEKTSEAALIRGRIELTVLKNPEKKIILKASDKLVVENNEQSSAISQVSKNRNDIADEEAPMLVISRIHTGKRDTLPTEALWIEDKLAFDAEDFESLAKKLERRYNVSIEFKNEELKRIKFTGKFQNESIAKALKALQTTRYFHYKTNNNQIIIN